MKRKKLMSVLFVSFLTVTSLVVVLTMNLSSLSALLATQLKKSLSDYAHTEIDFKEINFSIFSVAMSSARIEISGIEIHDSKTAQNAEGDKTIADSKQARIGSLEMKVAYWPLLFGRLEVEEIVIAHANLPILKNKEGEFALGSLLLNPKQRGSLQRGSLQALSREMTTEVTFKEFHKDETTSPPNEPLQKSKFSFEIKQVQLNDLNASFFDPSIGMTEPLQISDIEGHIYDMTLPFYSKVSISAYVVSKTKQKLSIEGDIGSLTSNRPLSLHVQAIGGSLDLAISPDTNHKLWQLKAEKLNLANLAELVPSIGSFNTQGFVKLDLAGEIPQDKPFVLPSGNIYFSDVAFRNPNLSGEIRREDSGVSNMTGEIQVSKDSISVDSTILKLGETELHLSGKQENPPTGNISLTIDSPTLSLHDVSQIIGKNFPAIDKTGLHDFGLKIRTKDLLSKEAEIETSMNSISGLPIDLGKTSCNANISPSAITIKNLKSDIANGNIEASGGLKIGTNSEYSIQATAAALNLKSMLAPFVSKFAMTGTLKSAKISMAGQVINIKKTSKGTIELLAVDGNFEGINVLGTAFSKLATLPIIGQKILKGVPPDKLFLLEGNSSPFKEISLRANVADNVLHIESAQLEHQAYALDARGSMTLDGEGELIGKLSIKPVLSVLAIAKEPSLKLLLDPNGNMIIPVIIKRAESRFLVLPDIKDLTARAAKNTTVESVNKLLNKLSRGKRNLF